MNRIWQLEHGARVVDGGRAVRFRVWAPGAKRVAVRLEGGRAKGEHAMTAGADGLFEATVPGAAAGDDYRYVLDGGQALADPVSRHQAQGVHGPSRIVDPDAFRWTDAGWRGIATADCIIYELHVGTFSAEGTFDGAIPHLADLAALGVTAIEVMPVAQFPGSRNWGYDGTFLYAAQDSYGGPEGLRRLVDAAHAQGIAVLLDVVYNHLGPEGNYLDPYGPYFTEIYRTPWGRAVNYDGPQSDAVRRYVIENALHWITEYHLDGLRFDAIHGIFDFGAEHVLAELTRAVRAQAEALGRQVVLIAESDLNDPKVVRAHEQHGYGFTSQWADDFHHAVHAAMTGETTGYYMDFADAGLVAHALRDPYVFNGRFSAHRQRRHGGRSDGLSREKFVVCVQNHDQVGNRAAGDRLSVLAPFERQKLAAALLLTAPYVPMLFMGEEYGETNPFQYFISHTDAELVEAVRKGRRKEFEAFGWGDDVPDPQDEATFARSRLDRAKREQPRHAALLALHRDLIALRKREPVLRPGNAEVRVDADASAGWLATLLLPVDPAVAHPGRPGGGDPLYVACNLADGEVEAPAAPWTPEGRRWVRVLSTMDEPYAGDAPAPDDRPAAAGARTRLRLAPNEAVVYRLENDLR